MSDSLNYDVIIVGSGLAGASLALALAASDLRVAIIDSKLPHTTVTDITDQRSVALTHGSHRIFSTLKLWDAIAEFATPIQQIHVSQQAYFGATRLMATEAKVPALGYVTGIMHLSAVLHTELAKTAVTQYHPAKVTAIDVTAEHAQLSIQHQQENICLRAKLIVAADGSHSTIRKLLHINLHDTAYAEQAIVAQIALKKSHKNIAFERFTSKGTLAFLPIATHHCGLVWSVPEEKAAEYATLSDADFLEKLQQAFGFRLGRFQAVTQRAMYPLSLQQAEEQIRPRVVLLGNAAHTLHPVAAQGFNITLRDVAALAEIIVENAAAKIDIGAFTQLQRYLDYRLSDQKNTIRFTDSLVYLWRSRNPLLSHLRAGGLIGLDSCPFLKDFFMQHTMGLALPMTKLTRGVPLC